jgi:hypothetical protein
VKPKLNFDKILIISPKPQDHFSFIFHLKNNQHAWQGFCEIFIFIPHKLSNNWILKLFETHLLSFFFLSNTFNINFLDLKKT